MSPEVQQTIAPTGAPDWQGIAAVVTAVAALVGLFVKGRISQRGK